jgi:hypothetical protein
MAQSDQVTVVIGKNEITKLLYEVDEISHLTQLVQRLEALYPQETDPKLVADMFLADQRLFGLIVYGHSVTDWKVEMLFGPLSCAREIRQTIDDVSESLGLPPPIIGD